MRRLLLHLAVALIAFVVGVTAALMFGAVAAPRVKRHHSGTFHAAPPPPPRSCPNAQRVLGELPELPEAPAAPESPAPPAAPKSSWEARAVVRRADGTLQAVTTRDGKRTERKY